MNKLLACVCLLLFSKRLAGQDFVYGQHDPAIMDMARYDKDTSAHAVVIREFGKAYLVSDDFLPLKFEYHVKIKIFDSKAFDWGNITIDLYNGDDEIFETVDNIAGTTFYKDEKGVTQQSNLDKEKIIREDIDKHHSLVKFAMPNLRSGCVIEYKYTVTTPYHYANFHSWQFQWDIPKMYSEYETHIPTKYIFNASLRGSCKLSVNTPELEKQCFSFNGALFDCAKLTLGMNDIPAFIKEAYMTSPSNFISAVNFELAERVDADGVRRRITKGWADIDRELKTNDDFGLQFKRKDLYKQALIPVIGKLTDSLQKARGIYSYIQHWFKWDRHTGKYTDSGIKTAIEKHTGNDADINFALIAALSAAGITTEAVMLSTRENGYINKLYPVKTDFNYVIAKANIGGKCYLLDATDPLLPFGMLPLRCINDQGRVMSLNKPSYWIDLVAAQKRKETTTLDLTLQDNGKLKGTVTTFSFGYSAYEKRKAIKNFNSVDEYVENMAGQFSRLKVLKSEITNLDSLELPLVENYDVEINAFDNLNYQKLTFNPTYLERTMTNPFKLAKRTYPVDLGSASDEKMILTLHFPTSFEVVQQPAPVAMALPNSGGSFATNITGNAGILIYAQQQQLNKAIYSPEEYQYIKELYNKMIQNQKADIVFQKKQ